MMAQGLTTQPFTHELQREGNMRGFAWLLVVLLGASYVVGALRPAVADESDEFRAVVSAAPSNAAGTDAICNALAAAAQENHLPIDFFTRLIWQESRFDPAAVSRAGAQGVAQFMPDTATWRGLSNPFNPLEAIAKSAKLLRDLRLARPPARTAWRDERLRAHRDRPVTGAMGRRKSRRW
jgi:soluble lytic murein transglycosylase-like protein